jgi:hypothetical protein
MTVDSAGSSSNTAAWADIPLSNTSGASAAFVNNLRMIVTTPVF